MARKGRPTKPGRRTKSGRRVPDARPIDKGNDRVQERRARYGDHHATALGRAYAAGLLGDAAEAQDRYIAGKRFARVYARVIRVQAYRCALNDSPRGNPDLATIDPEQIERDRADQDWLFAIMRKLDDEGLRPWLDQLVSDCYVDSDPYWLANILAGGKHPADLMVLQAAIKALDCIAPRRAVGIRFAA